ncbi:MAG: aminopeptidase [Candidatus Xenobiia bacterium LiM19]
MQYGGSADTGRVIVILNVDFTAVARKLVREAVKAAPGEVVLINGGLHAIELLEEIVLHTRCAGAFPVLDIASDQLSRKLAFEVPVEHLKQASLPGIRRMEMVDCMISVGRSDDPLLLSKLSGERAHALSLASLPVQKVYEERRCAGKLRTLSMGFPTDKGAAHLGLSFEEFHDLFWNAVLIDLKAMREREKSIAKFIENARQIVIKSEKGTDLTFSLEGRRILLDAGSFEDEDIASLNLTTNWPCGEVWVPPVEESAEGVAVFDQVFHRGGRIRDLRLTFHKGRVVDFNAEENGELFASLQREADGDKDVIAEMGIGTNPQVTRVTGDCLLDEKILGTVHIAIGSNKYFGGNNSSTIHKDMVMLKPSLYVEGKALISEGTLNVQA